MHQDLSNLADWQQLKQFRLGNLVNMISERINEIVMNVTQVAAARLKTNKVYQIQKKKLSEMYEPPVYTNQSF
jgi:hypothetical protein